MLELMVMVPHRYKQFMEDLTFLSYKELACEAVRKSLVQLKNGKDPENPFLPLDRTAKRILVAGTHADNLGYQCGGWTVLGLESVAELQLVRPSGMPLENL